MESSTAEHVDARVAGFPGGARRILGHLGRIGLGVVYLGAALTKAVDPGLFAEQIAGYGILPAAWAGPMAMVFVALETVLGVALIVNFRPQLAIPGGIALMLLFIGVLIYALATGYTGSCGCFGAASGSPQRAITEDVGFLALGLLAWFALGGRRGLAARGRAPWQLVATGLALAAGVAAPQVGDSLPLPAWASAARQGGAFDHIVIEEFPGDIRSGEYLVAILDPGDAASIAATDPLNRLVGATGVPEVVGVFQGDNAAMVSFLFEHAPAFDAMGHAPREGLRRFYRRLPVVLALRDGIILHAWHERVPAAIEVAAAFHRR